jgi:hypothetical protein
MPKKTKPVKEIVLPEIMQDCVIKFGKMLQAHHFNHNTEKATLAYVKAKEKAAKWFAANDRKLAKLKEEIESVGSGHSVAAPCIVRRVPFLAPYGPGPSA